MEGQRYVLGHTDRELRRLAAQALLLEPFTRRFFQEAGLALGMRVLDVGSGAGDVAFLAAGLVGESGTVIGVDRAAAAVEAARARPEAAGANVSFVEGDPAELVFDEPFDAVVGRYVLQFQPDAPAMLRRLATHVRPGGLVVFHEIDWNGFRSYPVVPSWERCRDLATRALAAGGAETQPGTLLASNFVAAGLPVPTMQMATMIGAGANGPQVVERIVEVVITLIPALVELGAVAPGELDPDDLLDQVLADVAAAGSVVVGVSEIAAWSRV